ncbi:MAG: amidohydrolase [Acutalibacteraceae bacterium]|nr:amidohydrolase [Acutalibacteraceae bacterium]
MKTLFRNADILLFENGIYNVLKGAFLAVDDDRISYIGRDKPDGNFDSVKDMTGKLLMSGFYNCHNHCPMVLLRGVGSDLPLNEWLFNKVFPIEDKLTAEEIYSGTNLALLEMLACGTVSFSDMYFEPQVTAKAVAEAGMKANITRPVQSFDPNEEAKDSFRIAQSIALYDEWNKAENERILIDFSIHAEYTCTEKIARAYSEECNKRNGLMHIHLSETVKEHNECKEKYGKTPTQWFNDLGAFDSRAFAAHCVTLEDSDMEIILDKGVNVVHNPSSNMKLGSGFARVQKMLDMGINVALGTDGAASNNNLDMMEEMHLASIIHNGYMQDATVMNADTVIKMATLNGALLQGRNDCGELKVGNKADIIAISLDAPHLRPVIDEKALVTYSAQSSDVCMTMVDGKILYENGEYLTLDKEKIYYDIEKAVKKLY